MEKKSRKKHGQMQEPREVDERTAKTLISRLPRKRQA